MRYRIGQLIVALLGAVLLAASAAPARAAEVTPAPSAPGPSPGPVDAIQNGGAVAAICIVVVVGCLIALIAGILAGPFRRRS